jgi:hypothetical protein
MTVFPPVLLFLLFFRVPLLAEAHVFAQFPPSRDDNPGLKTYPCGGISRLSGPVTTIPPGTLKYKIRETITHAGAPFRFALSVAGDGGFDEVVLYDHLPHSDGGESGPGYKDYEFELDIPDINCSDCTLQVLSIMTDKIPAGTCCPYPEDSDEYGEKCFSVYHTCSDVVITGRQNALAFAASYNFDDESGRGRRGPYSQESSDAWEAGGDDVYRLSSTYDGPVSAAPCVGGVETWILIAVIVGSIFGVVLIAGAAVWAIRSWREKRDGSGLASASSMDVAMSGTGASSGESGE